jgi:uncharacterized protein YdaU (DUF1376 family)
MFVVFAFSFHGLLPEARRSLTDNPWFKFDVAKERALMDTLTDEQYGAHMRLRIHAWTADGIPSLDNDIMVIGRWKIAQWSRIWPAISRHWKIDETSPDRLINRDLESERRDVVARSESGRKAVAKRWDKVRNTTVVPTYYQERTVEERTLQDTRERESSLSLVAQRDAAPELSLGQLMACVSGLTGAWNNIAVGDGRPFVAVTVRSHAKATAALRAHPDIDWWGNVFRKVAASDYLCGRVPGRDGTPFIADFWWALDRCEEITTGRYDNRAVGSRNSAALAEVLKDLA